MRSTSRHAASTYEHPALRWAPTVIAVTWFLGFCAVGWVVHPAHAGEGLSRWDGALVPVGLGAALAGVGLVWLERRALLLAPAGLPLVALAWDALWHPIDDPSLPARLTAASRVPWVEACAFGALVTAAALVAAELRDRLRPRDRWDLLAAAVGLASCAAGQWAPRLWLWSAPLAIGALASRRRDGWVRGAAVCAIALMAPVIALTARGAAITRGARHLAEAGPPVIGGELWPIPGILWMMATAALAGAVASELVRRRELAHLLLLAMAAAAWLAARIPIAP